MTVQLRNTKTLKGEFGIISFRKLKRAVANKADAPFIKQVKARAVTAYWEMLRCGDDQLPLYALALGLKGFRHYSIPFQLRSVGSNRNLVFDAWEYSRDGLTRYEFFDDIGCGNGDRESFDIKIWREDIAPKFIERGLVPKGYTTQFLPHMQELIKRFEDERKPMNPKPTSPDDPAEDPDFEEDPGVGE